MEIIVIALIVMFIAFIFSIAGLGGALIYVPLFYWLGIELTAAIPAALLLNSVTTASASTIYIKKKMADVRFAFPLIATAVIFAPIGAFFTDSLDERLILTLFSAVLIIAGIRMFFPIEPKPGILPGNAAAISAAAGILIGFLSGLLGLGGGVFAVPLLLFLGFEPKKASATSAVFVFFTSLSGLLGHISKSTVDPGLMLYTGIAAFAGAQLGSRLMVKHIRSSTVLHVFGIVLFLFAAKIISGLT